MPTHTSTSSNRLPKGTAVVAFAVMGCWATCLAFCLHVDVAQNLLLSCMLVLVQTHLFTGLFITAHDAMHGTAAPGKPRLNAAIGHVAAALFALNSYARLLPAHHRHHAHAGTPQDPDYHPPGFLPWYWRFVKQYLTWWQFVGMAVLFNVAALWVPKANLILFYVLPAVLSTFQLFYFGTYVPHRGEHAPENRHKARSQARNHAWAFVSCYFFGYHLEHHQYPATPWYRLHLRKPR